MNARLCVLTCGLQSPPLVTFGWRHESEERTVGVSFGSAAFSKKPTFSDMIIGGSSCVALIKVEGGDGISYTKLQIWCTSRQKSGPLATGKEAEKVGAVKSLWVQKSFCY